MTAVYRWIVSSLSSLIAGLLSGGAVILPAAVKEHFFSLHQRILSFLFLILIVNGLLKFLLSVLKAFIEVFGVKDDVLDRITNPLFYDPHSEGYYDGWRDGCNGNVSRLELLGKKSLATRLWRLAKYCIAFIFLSAIIRASNW